MITVVVMAGTVTAPAQYFDPARPSGLTTYDRPHRGFKPNRTETAYTIEFNTLKKRVAKLLPQAKAQGGAADPAVAEALRTIQRESAFLHGRWRDWFKSHTRYGAGANPSSDPYLRSLIRNNTLLKKALKTKDPAQRRAWIESVALDLQVKAEHCRRSKDGLGRQIKVKVHTRRSTNEVAGFVVGYVQKGWYGVPNQYQRFRRLSSPTEALALPPGAYAMWASICAT